jgi:phage FluMu protein Com
LKLTRDQACRLWAVDDEHCVAAFEILLVEGFLHRTGTGKFVALPRPSGAFVPAAPEAAIPSIRCPHCRKLNTIQQERGGYTSATFRCVACHRILSITVISA